MPASKTCAHIYEVVAQRWPETHPEVSGLHNTVKLVFPDSVSLVIKPVRDLGSKNEKVSFTFSNIDRIITYVWNNRDGASFTCKSNPRLAVAPLRYSSSGKSAPQFLCSGNPSRIDPNALISTSRKQTSRVCEIDPRMLHLHYYPHEMAEMCSLIDAVFRCRDDTDYDSPPPIKALAAHRSSGNSAPRGPKPPPASDAWRSKWAAD